MVEPVEPPTGSDDQGDANSKAETPTPSRGRRIFSRVVDIALFAAVLGVLALAIMPRNSGPHVGEPAAQISLPLVGASDRTQSIPGVRERPLLIEAFASWCGACRRNSGLLNDLKAAQDEGRLDVVAVSVDEYEQKALNAKNEWPIPVDVFHDVDGDFARNYRVDVLPTYILIGVDGKVKRVTAGAPGASDVRAWLSPSE